MTDQEIMEIPDIPVEEIIRRARENIRRPISRLRFRLPVSINTAESLLADAYSRIVTGRSGNFRNDDQTKFRISTVAQWLTDSSKKPMLMLYGAVGCGKTTMVKAIRDVFQSLRMTAFSISQEYPGRTHSVEFNDFRGIPAIPIVTAQNILLYAKTDDPKFGLTKTEPFLAIDDLGVEPKPEGGYVFGTTTAPISDVIYERYENLRPTIITTNLSMNEIAVRYGDRIADRMAETFSTVGFTGENRDSYRIKREA